MRRTLPCAEGDRPRDPAPIETHTTDMASGVFEQEQHRARPSERFEAPYLEARRSTLQEQQLAAKTTVAIV